MFCKYPVHSARSNDNKKNIYFFFSVLFLVVPFVILCVALVCFAATLQFHRSHHVCVRVTMCRDSWAGASPACRMCHVLVLVMSKSDMSLAPGVDAEEHILVR